MSSIYSLPFHPWIGQLMYENILSYIDTIYAYISILNVKTYLEFILNSNGNLLRLLLSYLKMYNIPPSYIYNVWNIILYKFEIWIGYWWEKWEVGNGPYVGLRNEKYILLTLIHF